MDYNEFKAEIQAIINKYEEENKCTIQTLNVELQQQYTSLNFASNEHSITIVIT